MRHDLPPGLYEFMQAKNAFIRDPGCDPDIEEIAASLGHPDLPDDELVSMWIDIQIEGISTGKVRSVFRHMTVHDFEAFVSHASGGGAIGDHWSDNPDTWSHYSDALGCNIRIEGVVPTESIDWFTTLQRRMAFPAEREIVFEGDASLAAVTNLDDGNIWRPGDSTSLKPR